MRCPVKWWGLLGGRGVDVGPRSQKGFRRRQALVVVAGQRQREQAAAPGTDHLDVGALLHNQFNEPGLAPERGGLQQLRADAFFVAWLAAQARAFLDKHASHGLLAVARPVPEAGLLDASAAMKKEPAPPPRCPAQPPGDQWDAGFGAYPLVDVCPGIDKTRDDRRRRGLLHHCVGEACWLITSQRKIVLDVLRDEDATDEHPRAEEHGEDHSHDAEGPPAGLVHGHLC